MGFPLTDSGDVTEDVGVVGGFLTASGDIDFGPLFNDDAGLWTAETISGAYGSQLVIDADGVWTYTADNADATIQALDTGDSITEVFTVTSTRGTSTITITINGTDEPPCFVSGTLVDTPHGPRPIEDLRAGDAVLTRDNGVQVIRWTGARHIALGGDTETEPLQPIRLRKDCFGPGVPDRDLLLSPMHRVLLRDPIIPLLTGTDEVLCAVRHLVNGQTIVREAVGDVRYHHLLFDDHQVLSTSGCGSESFYPGRVGLEGFADETRNEVLTLFPDLRSLPESYGHTARRVVKKHEAVLLQREYTPAQLFLKKLLHRVA
ncbi:MAG: Hint domain-containing protein [Rhodobacter sp.]|nr:Hint domain-containing protein [Rhodobacter sp.]